MESVALIPAYKPEEAMLPFLRSLRAHFGVIVVVNDGSGDAYDALFDRARELGAVVLDHAVNLGKGRALKTGLNHILHTYPDCGGVITADCDGQHAVEDILAVRDALREHPDRLILGERRFTGKVPARSRFGNGSMRFLFALSTGTKLYDTQTGLRGFPRSLLPELLRVPGERYEYEINMLLRLPEWNVKPLEVPIQTIYLQENQSSHYHPLRDSARIAARMLLFSMGSLLSYFVDYGGFLLFLFLGLPEWACFGTARVLSSTFNYLINSRVVFRGRRTKRTVLRYYALALFVLLLGMAVLRLTTALNAPLLIKVAYDLVMYVFNYFVQRDFVFREKS